MTSIGYVAFYLCSRLTSVSIGNSVTTIGGSAFNGCSGLTNLILEDGDQPISGLSFPQSPLETLYLGRTTSDAFAKRKTSLKALTIGDKVYSIANNAFDGCSGLTGGLTIPDSVTKIGQYAFYNCSGLNGNLTLGNSVTTIGRSAFYNCNGLNGNLTLGNSVTEIGGYAFEYCTGLTSVTIGNSVTSIGEYAFYGCSGLTEVTIGNSVTSIGEYAFYRCSGLTVNITDLSAWCKISFGNYYAKPSGHLKLNGTEITNLVIPDEITEIKSYAFYGCGGLTSVSIGNSVTSIGYMAFYFCNGLSSVTSLNTEPPVCNAYTFEGVPYKCSLYVPSESKELYAAATGWSKFANIIGFDDVSVEIQGDNATFEIPTTEGATTYTVNVYSDEAMTQLVATTNYDAAGNIIPMSTSLELSIDGFANGTYYYDVIAKSESGDTLNNYTGSFKIDISGIGSVGSDDTATEVARYDIHGCLLSAPVKGINIVKYSDGTTRKEFVR